MDPFFVTTVDSAIVPTPSFSINRYHNIYQTLITTTNILSVVDKFVMLRIFPGAPGCARAHPGAPQKMLIRALLQVRPEMKYWGTKNGSKIYWK